MLSRKIQSSQSPVALRLQSPRFILALIAAGALFACSGSDDEENGSGAGGTGNGASGSAASTGGSSASTGGSSATSGGSSAPTAGSSATSGGSSASTGGGSSGGTGPVTSGGAGAGGTVGQGGSSGSGGSSAGAAGAGGSSGSGGTGGSSAGSGGVGGSTGGSGGSASGSGGSGGTGITMPKPVPTTWVPVSDYKSTKNVPHGKIEVTTYDNPGLSKTGNNGRKASVYLPPGYDATKKYPVLYALHGIGGDHREWVATDSYPQQVLDNLYAANKIVPMIVVFPNGRAMTNDATPSGDAIYGAENSNAFNVFWDKDFKQYLIPHIEGKYSVYTDKAHRAVLGYSMGGMQALNFGLGNPDYFTYVGALAPATAGLGHPDVNKMNAAAVNANYVRIFISAGTADDLGLYNPAVKFKDALTAKGINNHWASVQGGGHNGSTWAPGLYNFTQIIFQ